MQLTYDSLTLMFLIGMVIAAILIIVLAVAWIPYHKVSGTAVAYSVGSVIAFIIGTYVIIGGPTYLHTWIGFFGGYLLLALSLVQAYFDIKKKS